MMSTQLVETGRHRPVHAGDPWVELRIALANRDVDDILKRYGVTDPCARSICGFARIVQMGRFYEPHPDGDWAIIVPVIDVDELVDLLAFDPSEPEK